MFTLTDKQRSVITKNLRQAVEKRFCDKGRMRHLANVIGVSSATVSRWVNGTKIPSLTQLFQLAVILEVPLHRLCGYTGNRLVRTESILFNTVMNLSILDKQVRRGKAGTSPKTRHLIKQMEKILANALHHAAGNE